MSRNRWVITGTHSVEQIVHEVGYKNRRSLERALKNLRNLTPGTLLRSRQIATASHLAGVGEGLAEDKHGISNGPDLGSRRPRRNYLDAAGDGPLNAGIIALAQQSPGGCQVREAEKDAVDSFRVGDGGEIPQPPVTDST